MSLSSTFTDISIDEVTPLAARMREEGQRMVQIFGTNTEDGIDVTYSFLLDQTLSNYRVRGVKDQVLPSIQGVFLAAFPFENECHDLFGVEFSDMVIDFEGSFYDVSAPVPMTIVSPEQKAAREKARKIAAAKAAKAAKAAAEKKVAPEPASTRTTLTEEDIEAKIATMDSARAAKFRAALEAKALREAKEQQAAVEKIKESSGMPAAESEGEE